MIKNIPAPVISSKDDSRSNKAESCDTFNSTNAKTKGVENGD